MNETGDSLCEFVTAGKLDAECYRQSNYTVLSVGNYPHFVFRDCATTRDMLLCAVEVFVLRIAS